MADPEKFTVLKLGSYFRLNFLGRGSLGMVYLAYCQDNRQHFAVKRFDLARLKKMPDVGVQMEQEVENLCRFDHSNILRLREVLYDPKDHCVYLVLDYADCGSLDSWIHPPPPPAGQPRPIPKPISEGLVRSIFLQICAGLAHIHREGFVHQDLKPANILLRTPACALIADFGVTRAFGDRNVGRGAPAYAAPRGLNDPPPADPSKEDCWSLGVSLYETVFGTRPYRYVATPSTEIVIPAGCDPALGDLLQALLEKDPDRRVSVQDALGFPWLAEREKVDFGDWKKPVPTYDPLAEFIEHRVQVLGRRPGVLSRGLYRTSGDEDLSEFTLP
jgi:serine/threonine-protein kinase 11